MAELGAARRSQVAREAGDRAARSNSERAARSACVGRRFSASQNVWNRSTRRAGARGGHGAPGQMSENLDDHRRIFDACAEQRIEGAAMVFKAPPGRQAL